MGCFEHGNKASVFMKSYTMSSISKFLVASEELLMSLSLLRKKPVSAENTMRLYYKDHSVNSVQPSYWCSVRESSEMNSIFYGKYADLLSVRLGALSPLTVSEKHVFFSTYST
jgi:hypothetical protein